MARVRHGKRLGPWYGTAIGLLRPPLLAFTRRQWSGVENLQAALRPDGTQQGIVVASNHISWFDPLEIAHALYDNGRPPRFLAKEELFEVPVVGPIIDGAGQIRVRRDTVDAARSVDDAVAAVRAGECVLVYPEGTITRDPGLWPMTGRTGAARIALEAGVPLIPTGMWGAQEVLAPYSKRLHLLPRKTMQVRFGSALDLDDLRGGPVGTRELRIATDRLMAAITGLVEELRGEKAPVERFVYRRDRHDGEGRGSA